MSLDTKPPNPFPKTGNAPTMAGVTLIVMAAILWSSSGYFTQTKLLDVWPQETRGMAIAFWRACFALVLLLPMVRRMTFHWAMIPMTIFFALMNWTYLTAIVSGSPTNTIWFQNLSPVWVLLAAVVILKEPTTIRDWTMMATCVSGVLFILGMEYTYTQASPEHRWWSPILAIASGIFYAGVIFSMKALRHHDSAWLISLNHIVTALAALPFVWWSGVALPSGSMWFLLAGIGMLQMGLPYFLFAKGLKTTPSHVASLITLLEPVLLPIWVHLTRMSDPTYTPPNWWTWVGAGLILTGLLLRYVWPNSNHHESEEIVA